MPRNTFFALVFREGATLEHLGRDDDAVAVRLPDGNGVRVARDYAWFVVVEREGHP